MIWILVALFFLTFAGGMRFAHFLITRNPELYGMKKAER